MNFESMDRSIPNWLDLPLGIFELIVIKLHLVDQVRALAVCKTWRDCKDYVRSSDTLPWVIRTQNGVFDLIDPYTRLEFKPSGLIINDLSFVGEQLAIKNGWVIVGGYNSKCFLYNPFTNDYIHSVFPSVKFEEPIKATISVDPSSTNWELFIGVIPFDSGTALCIDTYTKCGLTSWSCVDVHVDEQISSMLYVKGNIYCLSVDGKLRRYCVEHGEWGFLTSGYPEPFKLFSEGSWLLEINENIVMVRLDIVRLDIVNYECEWTIFKFDCSEMSWVVENSLKGCAIYITGDVAFSTPLTNQSGEKLEDCRLFHFNGFPNVDGGVGFKCYSLSKAKGTRMIQSEEYGWITGHHTCQFSFIEPPYFRS